MAGDERSVKEFIKQGYDRIAQRYLDWTRLKSSPRQQYVDKLLGHLGEEFASNSTILELGCGAGTPVAVSLASKCQHLVANDVSSTQISLAENHLREAGLLDKVDLLESDMTSLTFDAGNFDAVVGFYTLIHLSLSDQLETLSKIHTWLKAGGYLVCNFGAHADPGSTADDWLGMKSFWSSYGAEKTVQMLKDLGFEIVEDNIITELGDADFLWVIARKTELLAGSGTQDGLQK